VKTTPSPASTLEERIRSLEARARTLEPPPEERTAVREAVMGYADGFLDALPDAPTYRADRSPVEGLTRFGITEHGREPEEVLEVLRTAVDGAGLNPASAGHLGYIPGGGLTEAALGDYIAAVTNHYAGVGFAGPGAVEMERQLLAWMADLMGYPEGWGGNLASGGSIANLIAVVTAREAKGLRAADYPNAAVYTTGQVHHCVDKALGVAGLGEAVRRRVPTDDRWRMDPEALDSLIRKDREQGIRPWLVVASAGTTDVGAVDPLAEIGRVAREHDLWYHVDGAYGAFFALCPELEPLLDGIQDSDSLVMDPHKGLFLPYGVGAVLVRDDRALVEAHQYQAAYMQDARAERTWDAHSPADRSPELSRHWRGPRVWLPLMLHGVGTFRAALEEKHLLARYFHRRVQELGFEVGPEPELSVTTYRWVPRTGDANRFNRALVEAIHRDGRLFVSSTTLEGTFVLRLAVLSFRTHREHIDLLLEILAAQVRELEKAGVP
jgi:aromatic-L-amino-acid/L-tryptophan decarboxylase